MPTTEKFLFDLDFDESDSPFLADILNAPVEDEAEVEPVVPMFTEEVLEAAKQEAFLAGRQAGYAESLEGTEARLLDIITAVDEKMNTMFRAQAENSDDAARGALELAMAMARKMFPALNEQHGLVEIETLAIRLMAGLISEPRITVHVHESLVGDLETRLRNYLSDRGFPGDLIIFADASMASGDCRLEWSNGVAKRSTAEIMAEIEAIAKANILDESPPAPQVETPDLDAVVIESTDDNTSFDQPVDESETSAPLPEQIPDAEIQPDSTPEIEAQTEVVAEDITSEEPTVPDELEVTDAREMLIDRDPIDAEHTIEQVPDAFDPDGLDPDIFGPEPLDGGLNINPGQAEENAPESQDEDTDGPGQDEPTDPNSV